ncbi:hypothetical protein JCM19235_4748 [Vibrio maritimus]|uniref:Uncharacterized protein n=1 Tax=Vibrio maritimus TaxID=990268 RepID=A0A090S4Y3_9VIBR|nr:hypothetical protein JCM19235_4748 [Vibrio maritimus]
MVSNCVILDGAVAKILASTADAPFALASALFDVEDSQKLRPVAFAIGELQTIAVMAIRCVRDMFVIKL